MNLLSTTHLDSLILSCKRMAILLVLPLTTLYCTAFPPPVLPSLPCSRGRLTSPPVSPGSLALHSLVGCSAQRGDERLEYLFLRPPPCFGAARCCCVIMPTAVLGVQLPARLSDTRSLCFSKTRSVFWVELCPPEIPMPNPQDFRK